MTTIVVMIASSLFFAWVVITDQRWKVLKFVLACALPTVSAAVIAYQARGTEGYGWAVLGLIYTFPLAAVLNLAVVVAIHLPNWFLRGIGKKD